MKLIWLPNANRSYEHIMTCSTDFYGKAVLRRLSNDIRKSEKRLVDNPKLGAVEQLAEGRNFEYRHIVLSAPFKLIYLLHEDTIYIADIWDTRMCPERLVSRLN